MKVKLMGGGVDISLPNVSYCEDVKDVHYNPYNTIEFYVGEITGTTPQTVKIYTDLTHHEDVTVSEGNKWYSYVLPKDKSLCKIESGTYDSDNYAWSNGIVTKAVVKANINYSYDENNDTSNGIVPWETTEVSFKGSDTSKVTIMNGMFYDCSGLTSLDVSIFDTSNVTDMGSMFMYCTSLTSLDLSNFNTSNVIDMDNMFNNCEQLNTLNLSGWVISSNVTSIQNMFNACLKLSTITMKGCSQDTINKITAVKPSSAKIVTE